MNETSFVNLKRDRWIRLKPALILLRDARSYAVRTGQDVWQFATELEELQAQGLTTTDLRWLVSSKTVVHAVEITGVQSSKRAFEITNNLSFFERSCFVLSDQGLASIGSDGTQNSMAQNSTVQEPRRIPLSMNRENFQVNNHANYRTMLSNNMNGATESLNHNRVDSPSSASQNGASASNNDQEQVTTPKWDVEKRELTFGGRVIKKFKWPAVNQELLLCSFEELGWPEKISDPLPPSENVNSKSRLHDTIKCLNRHLKGAPFRFHGNGNGMGVVWRLVVAKPAKAPAF